MRAAPPLTEVVKNPHLLAALDEPAWDILVPAARATGLLARLAREAGTGGLMDEIPPVVRQHLANARFAADAAARAVRWEVNRISRAMRAEQIPFMLLKGAAYLVAGHAFAQTRPVSDVDILVRPGDLDRAEQTLSQHGWRMERQDPYDEHYYRHWMHELPPLRHHVRGGIVDLHHGLVPRVSPRTVDAGLLWEAATAGEDEPLLYLPALTDQLIHCAIHGMYLGEAEDSFRCALDLHDLVACADGASAEFWDALAARARALNAADALALGLELAHHLFATPVPPALCAPDALGVAGRGTRAMLHTVARPAPLTSAAQRLSRRGLQVRSHLHRMRPALLARHLMRKTWLRLRPAGGQISATK